MRNLHFIGLSTAVVAMLVACRAGGLRGALPSAAQTAWSNDATSGCALSSGSNLAVKVYVPSGSGIANIGVTDSVYGEHPAFCGLRLSTGACHSSGSGHACTAYFQAAPVMNEVEVTAYKSDQKSPISSGAFNEDVPPSGSVTANATLAGSIATISVIPFLTPPTAGSSSAEESKLPVGQSEHVWIVAKDTHGAAIIGTYSPAITIKAQNLDVSPSTGTLQNSTQAENVEISWLNPLKIAATSLGSMTASSGSAMSETRIQPATGIVYFTVGPSPGPYGRPNPAPGPVSVHGNDVYFIINDASGCTKPGSCDTMLGEFDTMTQRVHYVTIDAVPGVSQMAFTSDGALWMATYQPVGTWNYRLPVLRMSQGGLSVPSPLPSTFTIQGSGFVEDSTKSNLWMSGCIGASCLQNHNGEPVLVEASIASTSHPKATVSLPLSCAHFGYLGFTVADVAISSGMLYVIGLNDGSAPPARGTIWRYKPRGSRASCLSGIPANFNPSPYFATVGSGSKTVLVFGAGGNPLDFRWPPDHGFYEVSGGILSAPFPDVTPRATANHVAQSGGIVYYIHQDNLGNGVNVAGLGTYEPSNREWNVFPTASFEGPQGGDGVAAETNGAWFSADNVCGNWKGVCLGRARYLALWGVVPGLKLPKLTVGTGEGFSPMNVHSGPGKFSNTNVDAPASICTLSKPPTKSSEIFTITGNGPGVCPITVMDQEGHAVPVVTTIVAAPRK